MPQWLLNILGLGNWVLVVPIIMLLSFAFFGTRSAAKSLMVFGVGAGIIYLLKILIGAPRPEGSYIQDGRSFPSGHTFIAITLALFIIMYAVKNRHQLAMWLRVVIIVFGAAVGLAVSLTRVYLGVHTIWEVLGTYAIAAALFFAICFLFNLLIDKWIGKWKIWQVCDRYKGLIDLMRKDDGEV